MSRQSRNFVYEVPEDEIHWALVAAVKAVYLPAVTPVVLLVGSTGFSLSASIGIPPIRLKYDRTASPRLGTFRLAMEYARLSEAVPNHTSLRMSLVGWVAMALLRPINELLGLRGVFIKEDALDRDFKIWHIALRSLTELADANNLSACSQRLETLPLDSPMDPSALRPFLEEELFTDLVRILYAVIPASAG